MAQVTNRMVEKLFFAANEVFEILEKVVMQPITLPGRRKRNWLHNSLGWNPHI